jgi:hypothetical protein
MRLPTALRAVAPCVCGLLAIVGGLYFGLLPCGGHAWHRQAFWTALGLALAIACLAPPRALAPARRRLALVALVVAAFFLARAGAAPFFPAAPSAPSEYLRRALRGLVSPSC